MIRQNGHVPSSSCRHKEGFGRSAWSLMMNEVMQHVTRPTCPSAHMSRGNRCAASGNLSSSMRANYGEHGVEEVFLNSLDSETHAESYELKYYRKVGSTYRNPHFPGLRLCIFAWLNKCDLGYFHETVNLIRSVDGGRKNI
jgi:hypothetical protein